jgi:hypothetical protein
MDIIRQDQENKMKRDSFKENKKKKKEKILVEERGLIPTGAIVVKRAARMLTADKLWPFLGLVLGLR